MRHVLTILILFCLPELGWATEVPGQNAATGEYNPLTGELKISIAGAVNVYVESLSHSITPLNPPPVVPVGLLTNNSSRVGISNLGPINVSNFSFGSIGTGLECNDLSLHYTPALGQKEIVTTVCLPEPGGVALVSAGLIGLLAMRRKEV